MYNVCECKNKITKVQNPRCKCGLTSGGTCKIVAHPDPEVQLYMLSYTCTAKLHDSAVMFALTIIPLGEVCPQCEVY